MAELEEIWKGDHLERRADAEWLAKFLRSRSAELVKRGEARSYVLNLDAQWGSGKSFFLSRLQQQLESASHLAVYVNAWRDDFAEDPLVAVMAAIDETVQAHREELTPEAKDKWRAAREKTGKIALIASKGLAKRAISFVITTGAVEAAEGVFSDLGDGAPDAEGRVESGGKAVADAVIEGVNAVIDHRAEEEVSEFRKQQASIQAFRENLADFVIAVERSKGKAAPFFVLVDELDRCRPPYAIAMLERIKHLFETPGVVFIVATDSRQLSHAIKAVYGATFESARYLRRFFDQTYEFDEPSLDAFVSYLTSRSPIDPAKLSSPWENDHIVFLTSFFAASGSDLRTVEQIYNHLESLASTWQEPVPIELALVLPLIRSFVYRDLVIGGNVDQIITDHSPSNWVIKWSEQSNHSRNLEEKVGKVERLALGLFRNAQHGLEVVAKEDVGDSPPDQWIRKRLKNEFQKRTNGVVNQPYPMWSSLRDYPKLVRQAGRVKSTTTVDVKDQEAQ